MKTIEKNLKKGYTHMFQKVDSGTYNLPGYSLLHVRKYCPEGFNESALEGKKEVVYARFQCH
jgi:hypothetical protein